MGRRKGSKTADFQLRYYFDNTTKKPLNEFLIVGICNFFLIHESTIALTFTNSHEIVIIDNLFTKVSKSKFCDTLSHISMYLIHPFSFSKHAGLTSMCFFYSHTSRFAFRTTLSVALLVTVIEMARLHSKCTYKTRCTFEILSRLFFIIRIVVICDLFDDNFLLPFFINRWQA